jgi:UDP-N-acetylmuramate dehydrogenase
MHILEKNKELLPFNTFGLSAKAAHFVVVDSPASVRKAIANAIAPVRILGGGSNILFAHDVAGLLLKNEIKGITVVRQWPGRVHVRVGGGENWHDFVCWAVENGYGGVENLSLIPGTVGAAPIQNIGAYGVELKDVFVRLTALDLQTGRTRSFSKVECAFGYRDSVFKRTAKDRYLITEVVLSLTVGKHRINTSYGDISKTLEAHGVTGVPTIAQISAAVIAIRSSKLPDPKVIGNCGSFFKNPEVPAEVLQNIRTTHPNAPGYDLPAGQVKIPAGWLIEQCGWKGKRVGNTGSYEKQALVLVNHGGATGAEVRQLASDIIASVQAKFGVALEAEVNIW